MIKVIELRKAILSILKTAHPRVYYQVASKDAQYPYIVFDLPNSIDNGSMEQFVLDIDGWDDNEDTTALETMMDTIDKQLHRKATLISGEIGAIFYRENRLSLTDDDERIRRRKYIYQIRTY